MKKLFILILVFTGMLLVGCSNVSKRMPTETIAVTEKKAFEVTYLGALSYKNQWLKSHDGAITLKIKNLTQEVKYINWNSSSLTYNNFTSRVTTGNDRISNINSVVPNTAVLPNSTITVNILPADAIDVKIYPAATYVSIEPPLEDASEVTLLMSYSGKDINNLEQEIYLFKF